MRLLGVRFESLLEAVQVEFVTSLALSKLGDFFLWKERRLLFIEAGKERVKASLVQRHINGVIRIINRRALLGI